MESRKLKRMLELKRRIEQAKKGELALARNEYDAASDQLRAAQREHQQRLNELSDQTDLSAIDLSERARFVVLAAQVMGAAREIVAQRDREVQRHQEATVQATRDVRTFEVLTERDRDEQRVAARNAEQRAADDVAGSRRSKHESR